jgi:hypothetical protein
LSAGCAEQGFAPQAALAPTPLAAQWLALAGDHEPCLDIGELPLRLGRLPLAALDFSPQNQARLGSFGARCSLTCWLCRAQVWHADSVPVLSLIWRVRSAICRIRGRALFFRSVLPSDWNCRRGQTMRLLSVLPGVA